MKKLMKLIVVCLLVVIAYLPIWCNAQTIEQKTMVFSGLTYESGWGLVTGFGGSILPNVLNAQLSVFSYVRLGFDTATVADQANDQTAGAEVGLMWQKGKLHYGILLNAINLDWVDIKSVGLVTYLTNATGAVLTYDITDKYGISAWGRYKYQALDGGTLFRDRLTGGFVAYLKV